MRSTATDTLEVHAKLLPLEHRMQNLCYQAAIRLAAHPQSHPLHGPVQKAAQKYVKSHRSSLHQLYHASQLDIASVETITHSRHPPNDRNPYSIDIAKTREQAIEDHDNNADEVKVYCDGSGIDGNIGAAAVLYRRGRPRPRILRYHLGSIANHTVYEAEAVGLTLAAQLLSLEDDLTYPASIYVDNQATMRSGDLFSTKSGHYLIDHFRRIIKELKRTSKDHNFKVKVHWISGHDGVEGNERADQEAKKAARDQRDNSATHRLPPYLQKGVLPSSVSALKQAQRQESTERWGRFWLTSPRYAHTTLIDPRLVAASKSFISLVKHLPKHHISLMLWLCTRHISLNQHLHRIGKSPTPDCPHCNNTPETIPHYLISCPQYARERHVLNTVLRRQAASITYLLTNARATAPLIQFINSTGRLKPTFGDVPPPPR